MSEDMKKIGDDLMWATMEWQEQLDRLKRATDVFEYGEQDSVRAAMLAQVRDEIIAPYSRIIPASENLQDAIRRLSEFLEDTGESHQKVKKIGRRL